MLYNSVVINISNGQSQLNYTAHFNDLKQKNGDLDGDFTKKFVTLVLITFDKRVSFGFKAPDHCLVRVRMLVYLHEGSCITIMQVHTQTMQQTCAHKAVAVRVEAQKLLSRQRQLDYKMDRALQILANTIAFKIVKHLDVHQAECANKFNRI